MIHECVAWKSSAQILGCLVIWLCHGEALGQSLTDDDALAVMTSDEARSGFVKCAHPQSMDVTVIVDVNGDGTLSEIKPSADKSVFTCFAGVIEKLRFKPVSEKLAFTFKLKFPAALQDHPPAEECAKDADCAGNKVCREGRCAVPDAKNMSSPPRPKINIHTGRPLLALGVISTTIGIVFLGVGGWGIASDTGEDWQTDGFPTNTQMGTAFIALGLLTSVPGLIMLSLGAGRFKQYKNAIRKQKELEKGSGESDTFVVKGVTLTPSLAILPEGGAAGSLTVRF